MFRSLALFAFAYLAVVHAQQAGTNTAEKHPPLTVQQCSAGGSCTTQQRSIVLDSNWRWVHTTTGYTNCYTGNAWDTSICSSPQTCAQVSVIVSKRIHAVFNLFPPRRTVPSMVQTTAVPMVSLHLVTPSHSSLLPAATSGLVSTSSLRVQTPSTSCSS